MTPPMVPVERHDRSMERERGPMMDRGSDRERPVERGMGLDRERGLGGMERGGGDRRMDRMDRVDKIPDMEIIVVNRQQK